MSSVWFISDLHIGHETVCRHRAKGRVLPRYVGAQVDWHDRTLAANWDAVVGKDDVVWVLGDISSGTKAAQWAALEWLIVRPGHKHLIAGNHDSVHPLHRDSHKWFDTYMKVFESVQMAAKRRIPLAGGHITALLSHFPYIGDHTGVDRYPAWRLRDCGEWLLHGHTHSVRIWKGYEHSKQIHVGVDAWNFKPVALEEIQDIIREHVEGPPQPWEDVPLSLEGIDP